MISNVESLAHFDLEEARIAGQPVVERRLSQLGGLFADADAYDAALASGDDPVVYTVSSASPADGEGQLHYGVGRIYPGRVGSEYFLTRGHLHEWRAAAELYIGLSGTGLMLLEDEDGQASKAYPLVPNSTVYVPGYTAHRTINTGDEPLVYIGVYPARAGHDYGALAERNFSQVVVEQHGRPVVMNRHDFLITLKGGPRSKPANE